MSNESDSLSFQASISTTTVRLGDVVTLSMQATYPAGSRIDPPVLQKTLGTFEVFASTALPVEISGALETQRFEIQLQNFTTGQQVLPGLAFTYRDKDRQVKSVKTPEVNVRVEMVPPGPQDKGDIRGIKGVLGPVALSPLWWWLLAFAVLATAVALWSERRRKMKGPPPPPPVPADTVALEKLQTLLTSGLIEESKIKEFYSGLSDAVRGYIETGFECPALERTTGELMRDLRRRSLFASDKQVPLNQLLEECDLVKFAKFRPEAESCLKAHALAVQFVEQTRAALNKEESAR